MLGGSEVSVITMQVGERAGRETDADARIERCETYYGKLSGTSKRDEALCAQRHELKEENQRK